MAEIDVVRLRAVFQREEQASLGRVRVLAAADAVNLLAPRVVRFN